ncbi:MAG: hypothetical protein LBT00_06145 [Spirochaetaceae bacterium]|jgi:hypothetical protein|nr:hypothetical protein [Spirochaetaceae bacterium]
MKICCYARRIRAAAWVCGFLLLTTCAGKNGDAGGNAAEDADEACTEETRFFAASAGEQAVPRSSAQTPDADWFDQIERLAEKERSGGFESGAGLRESTLREQGGDYAGAVFATFKELFWAYSFAEGEERQQSLESMIEAGFRGLVENLAQMLDPVSAHAAGQAAGACSAFFAGRYEEAGALIAGIKRADAEPDEFSVWMGLVCDLENAGKAAKPDIRADIQSDVRPRTPPAPDTGTEESALRHLRASYAAIRSRYETLPAYWYFGARNMKGESIPAYAERAVNLSPEGPYAADARAMIAEFSGLSQADGRSILTMYEIETIVVNAVQAGNPELLAALFPLAALPDNPYTLYAAGAMRGVASDGRFKNYFDAYLRSVTQNKKPDKAQSRLAERLAYIVRGSL